MKHRISRTPPLQSKECTRQSEQLRPISDARSATIAARTLARAIRWGPAELSLNGSRYFGPVWSVQEDRSCGLPQWIVTIVPKVESVLSLAGDTVRVPCEVNWSRLSEQKFRVDKWSLCRG